tara:strand:+ start:53 stop:1141 length:1089 start_codon:yes stop_codon:yes gene_type:complete
MVSFTDIINKLSADVPFVGPETQERKLGNNFIARLGANESVFGPSKNVIAAMRECVENDIWKYGDPENFYLRVALSNKLKINKENIIIGEGIDALLGYLVRLLVSKKTKVITSYGAYPTFNYHVKASGGQLVFVPYKKDHENLDALIDAAFKHNAKLVYLANPDNPMGTVHEGLKINNFISNLPDDCILCLDEAYSDFAPRKYIPNIDKDNEKVIRFRTFSKAYGLAGSRIGYAFGEKNLIKNFDKIRNHFGVNIVAQYGALAALKDQKYLNDIIKKVDFSKRNIYKICEENNLSSIKSYTNFVAIDCGKTGEYAKEVMNKLINLGIFIRMPSVAPLSRCIRLTVGNDLDLKHFASSLKLAL